MTLREALPFSWTDFLSPTGRLGLGGDLGTTTGGMSNPTVLTVIQEVLPFYQTRLKLIFKTDNPAVTEGFIRLICLDAAKAGLRFHGGCIDATNETFFATNLKRDLSRLITLHLIKGSENIVHRGEKMISKQMLGNIYVNAIEDGELGLPEVEGFTYVLDDHRLVMREKGSFTCAVGSNGEHGDTFDGGKLALWALQMPNGKTEATAASLTKKPGGNRLQQALAKLGLRGRTAKQMGV